MSRLKITDNEKQDFIFKYFKEYSENPRFNFHEWEETSLDTRYRRIQDWLARKIKNGANPNAEEMTSKQGLTEEQQRYFDFLKQINGFAYRFKHMYLVDTQIVDLQRLKEDVNAFIDAAIKEKSAKEIEKIKSEIADKKEKLDNWDTFKRQQLTNFEFRLNAEKEESQNRLNELQERLKTLQG